LNNKNKISSKLKAQRAIAINPFQLSASGFHGLIGILIAGIGTKELDWAAMSK